MHKGKHASFKNKLQEHTCQQLVSIYQKYLNQWVAQTKKDAKHEEERLKCTLIRPDAKFLLPAYLKCLSEHVTTDRLSYAHPNMNIPDPSKKAQSILKSVMLKSGLFNLSQDTGIGIRILPQCVERFATLEADIQENIIIKFLIYGNGFLPLNCKMPIALVQEERSSFGDIRYYQNQISESVVAIFSIGLQKVPVLNNKKHHIQQFKFSLVVTLESIIDLEIIEGSRKQALESEIHKLEEAKYWNVRHSYSTEECIVDEDKKKEGLAYFSFTSSNCHGDKVAKVSPVDYKTVPSTAIDIMEYRFKCNMKVFYEERAFLIKIQTRTSEDYVEMSMSYIKAKDYVNFISEIPNFKFKLTKQQKEVVGEDGNLIVIGRSGTGKTLLSILRLYSIEFIKKQDQINYMIAQGKFDKDCVNLYFDKVFEQRNVFLTASSHLIEQIMKQYNDMHYQIQEEHKGNCVHCKEHLQLGAQMNDEDLGAVMERIEERQNIKGPISVMKIDNFPQFFTVKTMINIIDSGLQRPFFSKQRKKNQHKNIKRVNIYWEDIYRIYEPYQQQLQICFKEKLSTYTKIEMKRKVQKDFTMEMIEVEYRYFASKIWPQISRQYFSTVKREKHKLNAAVVWAEIFSIIKGSVKAHTTHLKCLSPKMYLQQSKSMFLCLEQKVDIYHLFEEYEKYKIYKRCYDVMDVVNHILQQILLGRYQDQCVDNMFIDEVQDLTPAMIYLLTKITKKDNFYCGDTAQAISKGVTFRFSQIKTLFCQKYFRHSIPKKSPKQEQHLTVNFRSHNRILMLANAIVSMIKELFPKTIDVMREERSDLMGPYNYIVSNGDERLIYNLLLGPLEEYDEVDQEQKQVELILQNFYNQEKTIIHQEYDDSEFENEVQELIEAIGSEKGQLDANEEEENTKPNRWGDISSDDWGEDISFQSAQNVNSDSQQKSIIKQISLPIKIKKTKKLGKSDQQLKQAQLLKRQLSGEQVILVRNQEEKEKLPSFLVNQHKLTCQEVKGLQYQDIIIYKFFSSSPCLDKWGLLDSLDIQEQYVDAQKFEKQLSRRDMEEGKRKLADQLEEQVRIQLGFDTDKNQYKVFEIKKNIGYHKIDIKQFYEIANELKLLYTLVTRAKNTVIIFDQKIPRKLERFFIGMNLAKFINNNELIAIEHEKIKSYRKRQSKDRYVDKNLIWRQQGAKMLKRQNYEEAMNCFQRAGDIKNVMRVKAIKIVKESELQLHHVENMYRNPEKLSREEFRLKRFRLIEKQNEIYKQLKKAAEIFKKIQFYSEGGKIFMKIKAYDKAKFCFQKNNDYERLAICHYHLKNYKQALFYYQKCSETNGMLDCYIKMEEWVKALKMIKSNKKLTIEKLKEDEKFKTNIKTCLKNVLESMIQKNMAYSNSHNIEIQRYDQRRELVLGKSIKQRDDLIYALGIAYNESFLGRLQNKLSEKSDQIDNVENGYKITRSNIEILEDQESSLIKQITSKQIKIKEICCQFSQTSISTFLLNKMQNNKKTELVKELQSLQGQLRQTKKELQKISDELEQEKREFSLLSQQKQNLYHNNKKDKINEGLRVVKLFKTTYHQEQMKKYKNIYQSNASEATENDLLSSQKDFNYQSNQVIEMNLHRRKWAVILQQTQNLLKLTADLMPVKPDYFFSQFDHRSFRTQIEKNIGNDSVLRNYRLLEELNCVQIGYLMCQKHNLKFHIVDQILRSMLQTSKNFLQKRRIKDVRDAFVLQQEEYILQSKSKQYQQVLERLNMNTLEMTITKKATKETSYQEMISLEIIQGVILQGFYQTCKIFCNKEQKISLWYMFLDYENLLKEVQLEQNLNNSYFLFPDNQNTLQEHYKNIVNIFSMQRIFFDHDQCSENPILSKPYGVNDFQLTDTDLKQCRVEADNLLHKKFESIIDLQKQLEQLQDEKEYQNRLSNDHIIDLKQKKRKMNSALYHIEKNIKKYQDRIKEAQSKKDEIIKSFRYMQLKKNIRGRWKQQAEMRFRECEARLLQMKNRKRQEIKGMNRYKIQLQKMQYEYRQRERQLKKAVEAEQQDYKISEQINKLDKEAAYYESIVNTQLKSIKQIEGKKKNIDLSIEYQINNIANYNKEKEKQKAQLNAQIRMWSTKQNMDEKQNLVERQVIQRKKRNKIDQYNKRNRQRVSGNINFLSNLDKIPKFLFLYYLINENITEDNVKNNPEIANILADNFILYCNIHEQTLNDHEIGLVLMTFLSFLFNIQFRKACYETCFYIKKQYQGHFGYVQSVKSEVRKYKVLIENAQKKISAFKRKLQGLKVIYEQKIKQNNTQEKMMDDTKALEPEAYEKRKSDITQEKKFFEDLISSYQKQIQNNETYLKSYKWRNLRENPQQYPSLILSLFHRLKAEGEENMRYIQILFGFFQCRVIRNCPLLQFLERDYALVEANSIVAKKLAEGNQKQFGYYFDYKNRTILAKFSDVRKIIINYLEQQHHVVEQQMVSKNYVSKIMQNQNKQSKYNLVDQQSAQAKNIKNDEYLFLAHQAICNNERESNELKKIFEIYSQNRLLSKVKRMKQEVLQFYLSTELREKQSFFFSKFQIKEYSVLEKMLKNMRLFNPNLIKEVSIKVEQLEKAKQQWINEKRFTYKEINLGDIQ